MELEKTEAVGAVTHFILCLNAYSHSEVRLCDIKHSDQVWLKGSEWTLMSMLYLRKSRKSNCPLKNIRGFGISRLFLQKPGTFVSEKSICVMVTEQNIGDISGLLGLAMG